MHREHGSYFFLAEIFTDLELEPTRGPYREHCGTCTRCLDLCPTAALAEGYLMEPRLCISYLTIENRGPIPRELRPKLGNWIFGCDICQEVCPWNEPFTETIAPELMPFMPDLMALDDAGFSRRFSEKFDQTREASRPPAQRRDRARQQRQSGGGTGARAHDGA